MGLGPSGLARESILYLRQNAFLNFRNTGLVALVESPLLNTFRTRKPSLAQNPHMFAEGWLTDAKLASNETAANSILDQVAIDLRGKMSCRVFEPFEDLQSAIVRHRPNFQSRYHCHN